MPIEYITGKEVLVGKTLANDAKFANSELASALQIRSYKTTDSYIVGLVKVTMGPWVMSITHAAKRKFYVSYR